MRSELDRMLHLELEPVGVFFGNTAAVCDHDASPEVRNCVVPLLMAAARGRTVSLDGESCNCPGGAVGCCFGDGFTRGNPMIHKLLSQGFGEDAPPDMPEALKEGERFFCTEEQATKWRGGVPYSERGFPRTVFAPESRWAEVGTPDLVYVFADPDQLSVLVTLLGFHNGRAVNTVVPYGSACQSIVYAAAQTDEAEPMAVMGLFDISQRTAALADFLSLTMPYPLWEEMGKDLDRSCLTTHSWREIEKRRYLPRE